MLNAGNEIAVQAFLDKKIGFHDIERINEAMLNAAPATPLTDLDVLREADQCSANLCKRNDWIGEQLFLVKQGVVRSAI